MTMARDHLSKADSVTVAAIEAGVLALVEARTLVERFHAMIRMKIEVDLEPWIAEASASLLASFAAGIAKSKAAVRAAITQPWSNGQTEGQVNKLKMVKRQMYGLQRLIFWKPDSSARNENAEHHRDCVRPELRPHFYPIPTPLERLTYPRTA
jgi:hypothetical protein